MNKKAAMFGLDARIALAIFGALSVISGAALYSAIQSSKITAFYTQSQEITKAVEQYYFDHGEMLPRASSVLRDARYLVTDIASDKNWNGPYIGCEEGSTSATYKYIHCKGYDGQDISTYVRTYADTTSFTGACTATDCDLWLFYHIASSKKSMYETIFDAMDKQYDNSTGRDTGNLKLYVDGGTVWLFMKMMPFENQL